MTFEGRVIISSLIFPSLGLSALRMPATDNENTYKVLEKIYLGLIFSSKHQTCKCSILKIDYLALVKPWVGHSLMIHTFTTLSDLGQNSRVKLLQNFYSKKQ